jgi:sigma-54 dependent transcriptional regulator, flagellar regulatory protein
VIATEATDIVEARGPAAKTDEPVFMVISDDDAHSRRLKGLIEFLDVAPALTSAVEGWRGTIGSRRLSAVLIAGDLLQDAVTRVISEVGQIDANAPIVIAPGQIGAGRASEEFPWANIYELPTPARLDELKELLDEIASRTRRTRDGGGSGAATDLVGQSAQLQEIRKLIERVAPTDSTILLTGESGTGKEVIARRIHELSGRKGAFVAVNCGAIPDQLLETELFGHERGAFTGAESPRMGRFELANGGTLFLDEIGDMPKTLQVKLLRVLQERCIERLGGSKSVPVDFRLIAATHRDLLRSIEEGSFREDLYYRLSVFPIEIPPLRERKDDIEPLIEEIVERIRRKHGVIVDLTADARQAISEYSWPGNVRELANLIERLAVIHSGRRIAASDLPWPVMPDAGETAGELPAARTELTEEGIDLKEYLSGIERTAIVQALDESNGVVQAAADRLGMRRTTLVEKIKKYGIS